MVFPVKTLEPFKKSIFVIHRPGLTEEYIHGAQDKERPIGDIDITRFEFFIE